jgi:hypothetical protein
MTVLSKRKGICSDFCTCTRVPVSQEQITDIENFVWSKIGKPNLPMDWSKKLNPSASYRSENDNFVIDVGIRLIFSDYEILRRTDEILSMQNIPEKTKEILLNIKKRMGKTEIENDKKTRINQASLKLDIKPISDFEKNILTVQKVEEMPNKIIEISSMIDLARTTFKMPAEITTCSTFHYDAKKFKPIGGIMLPTQLPISSELGSNIGSAQLYGLKLRLVDSRIGIKEVEVIQREKYLKIRTQGSFQLNEIDRLAAKAFDLSSEYSDILVVGDFA